MTRDEAIAYLQGKVGEKEPVFVLRAQDALAPMTLRYWAKKFGNLTAYQRQHERPCPRIEKIREAHGTADEMERWPLRKLPD